MHLSYLLPLLAILFQGGATLDDSEQNLFAKLCFLPQSPLEVDLNMLKTEDEKTPDLFHAVIGNKVMQEKLYEWLSEKTGKVPSKHSDKMCAKTNVEFVDERGFSFGKIWGFKNNIATFTCQPSKDLPGVERCNFASAYKKIEDDALVYFQMANANITMEIDCFKSGKVGWVLYSRNPAISEKEKKSYFAVANSLGFPENTNVLIHHEKCDV